MCSGMTPVEVGLPQSNMKSHGFQRVEASKISKWAKCHQWVKGSLPFGGEKHWQVVTPGTSHGTFRLSLVISIRVTSGAQNGSPAPANKDL